MTEIVLDVRTIEPHLRHPQIFGLFEDLPVEASFVLANDHDPRPLFYQFTTRHQGAFEWDYLEQGPQTWRVRITKVNPVPRDAGSSCCGTCGG